MRLTIEEALSEDVGEFTVTLTNKHGVTSCTANLTVNLEAPQFTKPLSDTPTRLNTITELICEVHGMPKPDVQWFRNDICLEEGPKYQMVYQDTSAILKILNVALEDTTVTYTCKAANIVGEATTSARLLPQGLLHTKCVAVMLNTVHPSITSPSSVFSNVNFNTITPVLTQSSHLFSKEIFLHLYNTACNYHCAVNPVNSLIGSRPAMIQCC